jgi:hypothetical protein
VRRRFAVASVIATAIEEAPSAVASGAVMEKSSMRLLEPAAVMVITMLLPVAEGSMLRAVLVVAPM